MNIRLHMGERDQGEHDEYQATYGGRGASMITMRQERPLAGI